MVGSWGPCFILVWLLECQLCCHVAPSPQAALASLALFYPALPCLPAAAAAHAGCTFPKSQCHVTPCANPTLPCPTGPDPFPDPDSRLLLQLLLVELGRYRSAFRNEQQRTSELEAALVAERVVWQAERANLRWV